MTGGIRGDFLWDGWAAGGLRLREAVAFGYTAVRMTALPELTDETVQAAVRGQREATDAVARVMIDRVRLMVYARLQPAKADGDRVEEVTQETMEALLRGLPTMQNATVGGLRAFASTIVARRVAEAIRNPAGAGRGRRAPASLDSTVAHLSSMGPVCKFIAGSGTSPLSAADREDQFQRAMAELSRLREEYRTIITMAFFDQLTTAQIAEQTGTTRQAAAMTLLRAVRALRERMTGADRGSESR